MATEVTLASRKNRDLGLDVVRLASLFAITVHHFIWVNWYTTGVPASESNVGWLIIENYARSISFSGHTILFLSSFLIARAETHERKTWKVVLWALMGWIIFCLFEWGQNSVFWVWDIYPLIAVGLASAVLIKKLSAKIEIKVMSALAFIGTALTLVHFWEWASLNALSLQWRHWLIGDCGVDLADWPLLPWIGFIWAGYAIGRIAYQRKLQNREFLSRWNKAEYVLWPVVLIAAIPQWGPFFNISLGPNFACFSFRQPPLIFWSHFIFALFLMRASLISVIQARLEKFATVRGIGNLQLSKNFGVAYLVHYILIEASAQLKFDPVADHWKSLFTVLLILPLTELILRGASIAIKSFSKP